MKSAKKSLKKTVKKTIAKVKATAKKVVAKKSANKNSAIKKAVMKKAAVKKSLVKKMAGKASAKKVAPKKAIAKSASKAAVPTPVKKASKGNSVAIFGGTFDPLHLGHLNSIQAVQNAFQFKMFKVIPAFQSPSRQPTDGPNPEQRLEMLNLAIDQLGGAFVVDDLELRRGGVSYTIDTVHQLENAKTELTLVIGLDQFMHFDKWKDFDELLQKVNLIVTSRPGHDFPKSTSDLPHALAKHVQSFKGGVIQLKSGYTIQFFQLEDIEISATEIRKRLRVGEPVSDLIPKAIELYIRKKGLYEAVGNRIGDFEKFTQFCGKILREKGGIGVVGFDLRSVQASSEFTIVVSGTSTKHAQSLAENLMRAVKDEYGVWAQSIEGQKEGRWVVLDYGSLIVHVFYDFVRQEYRLEEIWKDAEEVKFQEEGMPKERLQSKSTLN